MGILGNILFLVKTAEGEETCPSFCIWTGWYCDNYYAILRGHLHHTESMTEWENGKILCP